MFPITVASINSPVLQPISRQINKESVVYAQNGIVFRHLKAWNPVISVDGPRKYILNKSGAERQAAHDNTNK